MTSPAAPLAVVIAGKEGLRLDPLGYASVDDFERELRRLAAVPA